MDSRAAWSLVLGDYKEADPDLRVDALICDPPYSRRTHNAHEMKIAGRVTPISYHHWAARDVSEFVKFWDSRTRGWIVACTSHDLFPAWADALESCGRYVFHPIPFVHRGMNCRFRGDGPSSWAVWIVVARPRSKEFAKWGTLPGAYVLPKGKDDRTKIPGSKTTWLMRELVRDYSRPGDLVCDPTAGGGTTIKAAVMSQRRALGFESHKPHYDQALAALSNYQPDLPFDRPDGPPLVRRHQLAETGTPPPRP